MGIEKKAALICVVVLAVLFGIGLSNREDRKLPDIAGHQSREVAQGVVKDLERGPSSNAKKRSKRSNSKKKNSQSKKPKSPSSNDVNEELGYRIVKVKFRDNFSKIAARELGSANRYPILVKANPNLKPRNLREGQEVRIPMDIDSDSGPIIAKTVMKPAENKVKTYRVGHRETLSGIAQAQYGRASQWKKIFAANRNQLKRPESLRSGMLIRIP